MIQLDFTLNKFAGYGHRSKFSHKKNKIPATAGMANQCCKVDLNNNEHTAETVRVDARQSLTVARPAILLATC